MNRTSALPITTSLILIVVCSFSFPSLATAQVSDQIRQQRRQFVGELLKSLIESQAEGGDRTHQHAVDPNRRPPRNQGMPVAGTPELHELRKGLANFSIQCDGLVQSLQRNYGASSQARVLLADAMHVKAQCDALARKANYVSHHRDVIPDYQRLDQSWRVLNHRVRNASGIDSGCLTHVEEIHRIGGEMCTCLGVQPTLNRAELVRLMSAMNLSFQHLLQDLYYDNRNEPNIGRVIEEGQELFSKISQAGALVEREPYESLVAIYKDATKDWRRYSRKLRPYASERVRRDIQEIESIGRSLHEQLWLSMEVDAEYILDISRGIEKDAARLFASISLEDLLQCENPGAVLNSAREFQRKCGVFTGSLENGLESWIWDYQLFDAQWQTLRANCEPIQQARVVRRLREIDDAMGSLTQVLGQGPPITRNDLIQLTAQLDQLSTDLEFAMLRDIENHRGYDAAFRRSLLNNCRELHQSVHNCHQALIMGRRQGQLNAQLETIFTRWTEMKQLVTRCNDTHRAGFNTFRREIEPLMVKLQVVFTLQ